MKERFKLLLFTSVAAAADYWPTTARAETISEAFVAAYQNNPTLMAQREALKATDEGVSQALSGFFPSAGANASVGRERLRYPGTSWQIGSVENRNAVITQPGFNGGQSWSQYKGAKSQVRAGRARLRALEQRVMLDTAEAYTNILEKQEILELCRQNAQVLGQQTDASHTQFKAGEVTRTDVSQAMSRLASAQALERQAEGELSNARAAYRSVVGGEPVNLLEPPPPPVHLPISVDEAVLLSAQNPELQAAAYDVETRNRTVDERIGALLPSVSMQGSAGETRGASRLLGFSKVNDQSLTVNVSIPLYQSGAEYSRIREAKDLLAQSRYDSIEAQRIAEQNAHTAWEDAMTATAVIASSQKADDAAAQALDGVRQEHGLGTRTTLDILDAQQEAFATRITLARARHNQYMAVYRLLAATGQMEPASLGLGINPYDPRSHLHEVRWQRAGY